MQPLRRYTQCGSLTMLFGIFIVLFGVSSTALTTFGKSNSGPPATAGPVIKGRICTTHEDCNFTDGASCVREYSDDKMRCLCGDGSAAVNNVPCTSTKKELRHRCNSSTECDDGMVCQYESSNRTIGVAKFISSKTKICLCDFENGYREDIQHDSCSGSASLQTIANIIFSLLSTVVPFVAYSYIKMEF